MDNSLIFSQCSSPASRFDSVTYVSNHLQIGDLKRLCGFTIPSAQHEVWSSVCSGIFGNRIVEALNPNLPTVMFYSWGFQGKPGVPPLVCSWDWIVGSALHHSVIRGESLEFPSRVPGVGWGLALPPSALPHNIIVIIHWKIALNWLSLEVSMNVYDQDWDGVVEWSIPRFTVTLGCLRGWRVYFKAWFNLLSWELWKELGLWRVWIC